MKTFFLTAMTMLIVIMASAQHTNILIDDDQSGGQPSEPSIVIDPKNPLHIMAGSILNRYYYSMDGGHTWPPGRLTSPWGVWGDPVLAVDTNGRYYYFHLANPPGTPFADRIICQRADSVNAAWNQRTYFGQDPVKLQDKIWGTIDQATNRIYAMWTQFDWYGNPDPAFKSNIRFSRSTDGAQTWSDPVCINETPGGCMDDSYTVEGPVPAIGPNGEIYAIWAGPLGLMMDKSTDGGITWRDHDIFVAGIPGGWTYTIPGINRCNGLPVTKCDLSNSPHHGTIYVNWSDQRNGTDDTDIWLVKSTDGGLSWSQPARVNDDQPGRHQFMTWMDVDQVTGYLWFVWYDRRNHEDQNTDVYMAVSRDGGASFSNFRISESPFVPYANLFFGDYTNVSAHNNVVRPVWARMQNGLNSIWTAIINPDIIGMEQDKPFAAQPVATFPNPFSENSWIAYKLSEPSEVTIKLFDALGNTLATPLDHCRKNAGKYVEHISAQKYNLKPGVYFVILERDDQTVVRKIVMVN